MGNVVVVFLSEGIGNHCGPGATSPFLVPLIQLKQIHAHYMIGAKSHLTRWATVYVTSPVKNRYDYIFWLWKCYVTKLGTDAVQFG